MSERYKNTKALIVNGGSGEKSNFSTVHKLGQTISHELGYDIIPFHGEGSFLDHVNADPHFLHRYSHVAIYGGDGTTFTVASHAAATKDTQFPVLHPLAGGSQSVLANASRVGKPWFTSPETYLKEELTRIHQGEYTVEARHPALILADQNPARIDTGAEMTQAHWFAGSGGAIFHLLQGIEQMRHSPRNIRKLEGIRQLLRYVAGSAAPTTSATVGTETVSAHDVHLLKYPRALAHIQFPDVSAQLVTVGEGDGNEYSRMRFIGQLLLASLYGTSSRAGRELFKTRTIRDGEVVTLFQRAQHEGKWLSEPVAHAVIDSELVETPSSVSIIPENNSQTIYWGAKPSQ